jgi:hypothetical protein
MPLCVMATDFYRQFPFRNGQSPNRCSRSPNRRLGSPNRQIRPFGATAKPAPHKPTRKSLIHKSRTGRSIDLAPWCTRMVTKVIRGSPVNCRPTGAVPIMGSQIQSLRLEPLLKGQKFTRAVKCNKARRASAPEVRSTPARNEEEEKDTLWRTSVVQPR